MKRACTAAGILAALGIFIAVFLSFSGRTVAEEHQDHCICGGNSSGATAANGHTCATVTWTPVSTAAELLSEVTDTASETTHRYIYLTGPIQASQSMTLAKNVQLHICLNGQTLKAAKNARLFYNGPNNDTQNNSMSICDCSSGKTGLITIADNTTMSQFAGGLIYVGRSFTFSLYGGTIRGGRPGTGSGNVEVNKYNGGTTAHFYMYDGKIQNGVVSGTGDSGNSSYNGGNISVGAGTYFYMYGGEISGGTANKFGGNIYVEGTAVLKNGTISGGTGTYGGNIYKAAAGSLTIENCTVSGGTATTNNGGNIYLTGSTGGTVTVRNSTLSGGTSKYSGGNVYCGGSCTLKVYDSTLTGGKTTNGSAGNLYLASTAELHDTDVLSGKSETPSSDYCAGNINVNNGKLTMNGGSVKDGEAVYIGGNIGIVNASTVSLTGVTVENGHCPTDVSTTNASAGGNIIVRNTSTLTLTNCTVTGGTAMHGGNLCTQQTATVTLNNSEISGGTAVRNGSIGGYGGNISINGTSKVILNSGTITNGYANGNSGGNVGVPGGGTFTMNGGTVSNGRELTEMSGGIAFFYQADNAVFNLSGGTVTGNQVGIYMGMGTLNLSGNPVVRDNLGKNTDLDPASLKIAGALTSGADIHVGYLYGTSFGSSSTDYSSAFTSDYSDGIITYVSSEQIHRVTATDYVDINNISPAEAANMELDIYLVAGQSNASGTSAISSATPAEQDLNVYKNVHYYAERHNVGGAMMTNAVLDYRPVTQGLGYNSKHIGPELGMAQALEGSDAYKKSDNRQAIIWKCAAGGTSVLAHQLDDGTWDPDSPQGTNTDIYGSWYPSVRETAGSIALGEDRPTGLLTREFKATLTNMYQDLLAKGFLPENIHFISLSWLQGADDRANPGLYYEYVQDLMAEFRGHLYSLTNNAEDQTLPIVINENSSSFSSSLTDNVNKNNRFIDMQRSLTEVMVNTVTIPTSEIKLTELVNGTSVAVGSDQWHYKYTDECEIGQLLVQAAWNPDDFRHVHCECGKEESYGPNEAHDTHDEVLWRAVTAELILQDHLCRDYDAPTEFWFHLRKDLEITQRITLGKNVILHLCLDGYTLSAKGSIAVFGMNVNAEATGHNEILTICDCDEALQGEVIADQTDTSYNFNGGVVYVGRDCTFKLYSGTLTGRHIKTGSSNYLGSGGTVAVGSGGTGKFIMYGGVLQGGRPEKRGGNLFIENGSFEMYGGSIIGESGAGNGMDIDGGNIYLLSGTADIYDGVIMDGNVGTASGVRKAGGNVFVSSGTFTLHYGIIADGYAQHLGGNVQVDTAGTFIMEDGVICGGACYDGNGYNLNVAGTFTMEGGLITGMGERSHTGRYPVALNSSSARMTVSGGFIEEKAVQVVSTGSLLTVNGGSVYGVICYNGGAVINGGIIESAPSAGGDSYKGNLTVNGGYIQGRPTKGSKGDFVLLQGGFYTEDPREDFCAENYHVFEANETYQSTTYLFEIAKGYVIETTSRAATGYLATVGGISGGGTLKEGAEYTLTAPAVSGYRFIGWYSGETALGNDTTYTSTCTKNDTITAVYEVGAAEGFRVTVAGTPDYTITGETVGSLYKAGTEVTVTYTGTDTFKGFSNAMGKLVSRDAEYTFTLAGDTDLTAMLGSASSPLITFYTINSQVYRSGSLSDFTALPTVPAVAGKKNGTWKAAGTTISDVAALQAKAEGKDALDVTPAYEDDAASVYEVTVVGVLLGESGAPTSWTAYADGDASYGPVNVNATVKLEQPAAATKTFRYYANAAGDMLSTNAETYVRFRENATVYAVYADAAGEAGTPTVTFITAKRIDGTIYFEALRDVPAGYTLKEQGILFNTDAMATGTLEDALLYNNSAESYKYVSTGKNANDVTGLTLKNVTVAVNARAYVIYSDGTNEGIVYSEIGTVN